jgi:hypothetical protein
MIPPKPSGLSVESVAEAIVCDYGRVGSTEPRWQFHVNRVAALIAPLLAAAEEGMREKCAIDACTVDYCKARIRSIPLSGGNVIALNLNLARWPTREPFRAPLFATCPDRRGWRFPCPSRSESSRSPSSSH